MKRRRNPSLIIAVFMLVSVGMIIGYAYLSKTLNINGTIGVTRNTWNVKFRNIQVENGSVSATSNPQLSGDATTITITPTLNSLGDYYEFTVEVYNEGSIDAMLQAVPANPLSAEQQKLLEWSLTYDDGVELTKNDILRAKESDTLRVRVSYKTNIASENDLNSAGTSSISFTITYVQADSTSRDRGMNGARMLIAKANAADKNYAGETNVVTDTQKKEMFAFNHTSPVEKTDYRYIGSAPNNYIDFNCTESTCEEWRIIGVFDGKIKIMRKDRIEVSNLRWDYKQSGLGSSESNGSNDWSDAQLMYMLNKEDIDKVLTAKSNYTKTGNLIKDANQNVIYEIGKKPSQQANGKQNEYTGENGATTWRGLSSEILGQVAEVTWNLGGLTFDGTNQTYGNAVEMYQAERGTTTCTTTRNCTKERPTTWTGRVGLMYPSDYGYTFDRGVNSPCYGNLYQCRTSGTPKAEGADPTTSWLFESGYVQWTLSPYAGSSGYVMYVDNTGYVNCNNAYYNYGVRPVVFLKSDIRLQGSGTTADPYIIAN